MAWNWINAKDFSINSILLMDRWILQQMLGFKDSPVYNTDMEYRRRFGIVLANNPTIHWYIANRCPESVQRLNDLIENAPKHLTPDEVRDLELQFIDGLEGFIVYMYPEVMNTNCPYIRDWDPERLLSLVDFTDKLVLDIGSGTGRLAFAAATKAKRVYASEPADRLREYMRDKIRREQIANMVVLDGTIEAIPFEDDTFDIAMCGYVLGLDYKQEAALMQRVVKHGGYIINCPGEESDKSDSPKKELLDEGFQYAHYVSKTGGDVYRYWKKVSK